MARFPIALEITPPAQPKPRVLLRRARTVGGMPAYINVIQRSDRWSSLDASIRLREHGFDPVWHLANRGRSISRIDTDIARARQAGLSRVLCIRGEHKSEDSVDTPKIREVVRMLNLCLPGVHIGVTLNHHGNAERTMANLWPKLDAGARSIQTQLTFELDSLAPLARELKHCRPDVAIMPMLMPLLSEAAALQVTRRLSIPTPAGLVRDLRRFGPDAGWAHFGRLVALIRTNPLYDGVAIMTPIDMGPAFAARVRDCLS